MTERIKVIDVEWPLRDEQLSGYDGYGAVWALVRSGGRPVASALVPLQHGRADSMAMAATILESNRELAGDDTASPDRSADPVDWPLLTVAVCTRDRTADLRTCLAALAALEYPCLDLLVVDNAPSSDDTAQLVTRYAAARYVREDRPGLNHARNRAVAEAHGDLIAFIDDDAVADPGWAKAVVRRFLVDSDVVAVTGLVVPYELETAAQIWFEEYGGFGCGYARRRFDWRAGARHHEVMECGTGANMAFRRSAFAQLGRFDPALDAGTATGGGGDIDMFFRVLREGGVLEYEPAALVRHMHRRDFASLRGQIMSWGTGMIAVFARNASAYPSDRWALLRLAMRGFMRRTGDLVRSLFHPPRFPRRLIVAELRGSLVGLARYRRARAHAGPLADHTAGSGNGE
jgi:O-antigen biosynthesis protein